MSAIPTAVPSPAPERARVWARAWSVAMLAGAAVLAFLLSFRFDSPAASYDLDPSWAAVVGWGLEHARQWGRDLAFTYGPLGLLSPYSSYRSAMIGWVATAQVGFAALYAFVFLRALQAATVPVRAVALALLLAFGAHWAGDVAWLTLYPLALLALWPLRGRADARATVSAAAVGLACGVPWLAKFSLFPLWLVWLACVPLVAGRRAGGIAAIASLAASAALWLGAGQQAASLWPYLSSSWRIAAGYAGAMQWQGLVAADAMGLGVLALALATQAVLLLRAPLAWRQRLAALALTAGCTALAFKAAYTRADAFHLPIFYPACAIAVLVAASLHGPGERARIGAWLALACALVAFALPHPPSQLRLWLVSGPPGVEAALQRLRSLVEYPERVRALEGAAQAARAATDLPNIRRVVGDAPIDILPIGQGLLLAHGMNYRPRPVFQGYSAYTPALARMNAEFFASARAPRWVLLDMYAIDGRYPPSEDPQALLRVLGQYRPLAVERGLVLMQRTDAVAAVAAAASVRAQGRVGEFLAVPELPGDGVELRLALEPTLWSRAATASLRAPRLFLDLDLGDGRQRSYRLVPGAAEAGFLLSPAIEDTAQLWAWLERQPVKKVLRFRVRAEDWLGQPSVQPTFGVSYRPMRLAEH